jgi:hypothetical protein
MSIVKASLRAGDSQNMKGISREPFNTAIAINAAPSRHNFLLLLSRSNLLLLEDLLPTLRLQSHLTSIIPIQLQILSELDVLFVNGVLTNGWETEPS